VDGGGRIDLVGSWGYSLNVSRMLNTDVEESRLQHQAEYQRYVGLILHDFRRRRFATWTAVAFRKPLLSKSQGIVRFLSGVVTISVMRKT